MACSCGLVATAVRGGPLRLRQAKSSCGGESGPAVKDPPGVQVSGQELLAYLTQLQEGLRAGSPPEEQEQQQLLRPSAQPAVALSLPPRREAAAALAPFAALEEECRAQISGCVTPPRSHPGTGPVAPADTEPFWQPHVTAQGPSGLLRAVWNRVSLGRVPCRFGERTEDDSPGPSGRTQLQRVRERKSPRPSVLLPLL